MEKKKGSAKSLEKFFAGKGFYIVLFLCVAVIGVSAWAMLTRTGTDVDDGAAAVVAASEPYTAATAAPVIPPANRTTPAPKSDAEKPSNAQESPAAQDALTPQAPEIQAEAPQPPDPVEPDTQVMAEAPPVSYIWPLVGEIEIPYSVASLIYNKTMADWRTHDGVDISAELGAQVMAISAGRVERVYTDDLNGVTVVVDHGGGLRSVYSNLAETPTVYEGSSVAMGEIIGSIGTTALAETGEVHHLHLGMTLDGLSVDPMQYLPPR